MIKKRRWGGYWKTKRSSKKERFKLHAEDNRKAVELLKNSRPPR